MDKCPFCGAKAVDDYLTYACGTTGLVEGREERGSQCYETELARKDELLRGAIEILNKVREARKDVPFLGAQAFALVWRETQAFLTTPEVVKVMEGK